jgi:predicted exporter
LETDIAQLVPDGEMDSVAQGMYRDLLEKSASRLIILVEGHEVEAVEGATITLHSKLGEIAGVKRVDAHPDSEKLTDLVDYLLPFRESLLSAGDRVALSADTNEAVTSWRFEDPFFRPVSIENDPLGTLGRFISESLSLPGKIESDGFFYWIVSSEPGNANNYATTIFVELDFQNTAAGVKDRLHDSLTRLVKDVQLTYEVEVNASSVVFHASVSKAQAKWESTVFGLSSVLLILVLLVYSFSRAAPVIILFTVVGVAFITGFAVADWIFSGLHALTMVMALPVIGISVDYVIHSQVNRDVLNPRRGLPPHLIRALTWGCLSSVLGFAALGGVDIIVLKQVSVILIVGLVTALLWVIALARVFAYKPRHQRIARLSESSWIQKLSDGKQLKNRTLATSMVFAIGIAVFSIWSGTVPVVDNPNALRQVDSDLAQADLRVEEKLALSGNRRALVVEAMEVEELLQRLEDLMLGLTDRFQVSSISLSSLVPSAKRQYENRALLSKARAILNSHDTYTTDTFNTSVDPSEFTSIDVLSPQDLPSGISEQLPVYGASAGIGNVWASILITEALNWEALQPWCENQPGCRVVDSLNTITNTLADTHRVARFALYMAMFLVSLILILRYRLRGIWASATLLLVVLSGQIVPGLLGIERTLFSVGGLFVLLGLSVDYLVFTAEATPRRNNIWLAFNLSAATTLLTFGFLLFSETPAVRMLAAPITVGLPLLLAILYFVQHRLIPPQVSQLESTE